MENPELPVRITNKHHFTGNERLAFLAEWEKCVDHGSKSAFCRRVGIDPKSFSNWSRDKRDGVLVPDASSKNKYILKKRERTEFVRLQRENARLTSKLEQAESAVEVLGKASELLTALAKSSQLKTPSPTEHSPIPPAFRQPNDK